MTSEELCSATGASANDAIPLLPFIEDAMAEFEINTPRRQAMFLAQVGHESGGLHFLREIWGPTPTQKRYEGRVDLGNLQPGDGSKFRGRGLIQVTGRSNYEACGEALDLPLLDHPELLETPKNAVRSAAWFWKVRGLNELADVGDFMGITRRINGGLNGYDQRVALYGKAQEALV
jgi:putative chitinase